MSPPSKDAKATVPPQPDQYRFVDSMPCKYIVSVAAAGVAELLTYPLDLTKTRLQIQGESATTIPGKYKYRGMMATAFGIIREEGPFKLWQGMTPMMYRHVVYSGVRVCLYDYLRKEISKDYGPDEVVPVWKSALCGIFAGCFAQWLSSPADLVKVQVQMEGKHRLMGEKPRVKGAPNAFIQIVKRGGVVGLWKGSVPNIYRAAFVNLGDLTTYDTMKQVLMKKLGMPDGKLVHTIASFGAGGVAAVLATPAEVIKTRVMNQPTDEKGRGLLYKGPMDCLHKTVKQEGLAALYKGLLPCWLRMAPWAMTFWISYEQIRQLIGASMF